MMDGETKPRPDKREFVTTPNPDGLRRWLIEATDYSTNVFQPRDQPLGRSELVEALEAEPVLDLLEHVRPILAEWKHGNSQSLLDVTALLAAHGRLDAT
jgi:hypothetical protein